MEEELQQLRTNANGELMSDEDFIKTIESMGVEAQEREINDLLKAMHESRIVSWDEAERILQETDRTPVKCSLPEQTRPTEPDNEVDVDQCIRKLLDNDPSLKEVNLNNMKRTPIPAIKRLLEALAYNEHCERVSLANMGLYDHDVMVLVTVIEMNQAIKKVNLETNYLSGEFFAKLFQAALNNQTVEEIKAVNQGVSFSTQSEKEIIDAIVKNKGLTKISINFRLPEGRHKVEHATLRNGELKRVKRREAAQKARLEAEELAKNPVPKLTPEPKKEEPPKKPAKVLPTLPKSLASPEPKPSPTTAPKPPVMATAQPKPSILAKQLSFQRASKESEEETEELVQEAPKKLRIPKSFVKSEEKPEVARIERRHIPKKVTKEWAPKKFDEVSGDEQQSQEIVEKKHWEPKIAPAAVDEGYAPVINVGGPVPEEPMQPKPVPRRSGPPVTAKNIWEQRIAKMEKKEEKKKERPLMSIQKIREIERKKNEEDRLSQLLKKEPKKLGGEKKKIFESNNNEDNVPKVEKRSTQKIVAKKINPIIEMNMEKEGNEPRPMTVIRRTVNRKKNLEENGQKENSKDVMESRRIGRKNVAVPPSSQQPPTATEEAEEKMMKVYKLNRTISTDAK